jgi:hypothetical protein
MKISRYVNLIFLAVMEIVCYKHIQIINITSPVDYIKKELSVS